MRSSGTRAKSSPQPRVRVWLPARPGACDGRLATRRHPLLRARPECGTTAMQRLLGIASRRSPRGRARWRPPSPQRAADPVVPFALIGYAAGAARVNLWRFCWTDRARLPAAHDCGRIPRFAGPDAFDQQPSPVDRSGFLVTAVVAPNRSSAGARNDATAKPREHARPRARNRRPDANSGVVGHDHSVMVGGGSTSGRGRKAVPRITSGFVEGWLSLDGHSDFTEIFGTEQARDSRSRGMRHLRRWP